jgi:hypothetical protein
MLAALLLAGAHAPAFASEDAFAWTYRYLAVNAKKDAELLVAVNGIARTPDARTRETYDVLAQLLLDIAPRKGDWQYSAPNIVRLLVNGSEAARYHTILESLRKEISPPRSSVPYTRQLSRLEEEKAEQYVAGTIDIAALREGYLTAALAVTPTMQQAQAIDGLKANASLDELFAVAGHPAHVGTNGERINDAMGVGVRQLWFYYRGIGRVSYDFEPNRGWSYYQFIAEPMTFEGWMPYRALAKKLGLPSAEHIALVQLVSGNPLAIRVSAQAMHRVVPSVEYMDTVAEVLLRDFETVDDSVASDAYAWLCTILAEHGGPRYARVLARVKKNAKDLKLKRYAEQPIHKTGPENVFVPGALSLDAQKAKYPSLYPQITLVRVVRMDE